MHILLVVVYFFLSMINVQEVAARRRCGLPICDECVPYELIHEPGIGFDLAASYATAAVRYHDGSRENLAKIEGDSEYNALMVRFSQSTSSPDSNLWDRLRRRTNKLLGRPATVDVGTLSNVLTRLRKEAEKYSNIAITSVVVVMPNFRGIQQEDLDDAIEYAGLKSLMGTFPSRIPETQAAYAGNQFGLCINYVHPLKCEEEEENMPLEQVLAVHYSRHALSVTLAPLTKAFSFSDDQSLIDWKLGLNALSLYPNVNSYWEAVGVKIQEVPNTATGWGKRPVTKVLLLGESALDPRFLKALQDALGGIRTTKNAAILKVTRDPLYAAARGAAEFAKRLQEAPRNCIEPEHCREIRREPNLLVQAID